MKTISKLIKNEVQIFLFLIVLLLFLHNKSIAIKSNFIEINLMNNFYNLVGDSFTQSDDFAFGFNIAHGTKITNFHALVMNYGKTYLHNNAILTTSSFFLRRYIPSLKNNLFFLFLSMGSTYSKYEVKSKVGSLRSGGFVIGIGSDLNFTKKTIGNIEINYQSTTFSSLNTENIDKTQTININIGIRYSYYQSENAN